MMRSISLLACLAFSFLNAQNDFSFVTHQQWANYAAMDVQGEAITLAGFQGQCDAPYVTYLDKNTGEELWSSSEAAMYYGTYTDVKFAPDGSFWAAGWRRPNDHLPDDEAAIITHFSASGEVLFHREDLDEQAYEGTIISVHPLENGQVFWNTGLTVQRLNNNGSTDLSWTFNGLKTGHMAVISAESFVVNTDLSILYQPAAGELQEIFSLGNLYLTDLEVSDEGIYWTGDNLLFFYDFITEEVTEWPLPPNFTNTARINITESEVQIYSTLISPHAIATLLPDQSEVVITQIWETPDRTLFQAIEENGTFYQLGNDLFESELSYAHLSHGYVRKSTGLPPITGPDIGITGINMVVDSINLYVWDLFYKASAYWSGEIQVTNFSDAPIENFLVASPIEGHYNCAEGRFFSYQQTTIPANSTFVFPFTYDSDHWVELDEEGDFTFNLELCLYTAAPNSELDEDTTNDHFCETFVIVDTEEQLPVANELHVFPNPATDQITVSLPGTSLQSLSVYDQTGRLMLQQLAFGEREEVDLSRLPSGMYWLKVVTSDGAIGQKISKQ